ncbi:hypothetical protein EV127DRAFT_421401 [Xylaria flabelliformis]|nr:hypothetical protein EV127DRAFT_421401 [Xylaria flabelliformis]
MHSYWCGFLGFLGTHALCKLFLDDRRPSAVKHSSTAAKFACPSLADCLKAQYGAYSISMQCRGFEDGVTYKSLCLMCEITNEGTLMKVDGNG